MKRKGLFAKTKTLEEQIALFFDNILQAGQLFVRAMNSYYRNDIPAFLQDVKKVSSLEKNNDALRRTMERTVYGQLVLPDMQSDILHLLEGSDKILNHYESHLLLLSVEKVKIPKVLIEDMKVLEQKTSQCVDDLVSSCQGFFFSQTPQVENVRYLEHEIDKLALQMKERIFADKRLTLARQIQLKTFITNVEKISDLAEDVSDTLTVVAVKHRI